MNQTRPYVDEQGRPEMPAVEAPPPGTSNGNGWPDAPICACEHSVYDHAGWLYDCSRCDCLGPGLGTPRGSDR